MKASSLLGGLSARAALLVKKMAATHVKASSILSSFLPRFSPAAVSIASRPRLYLPHKLLSSFSLLTPSAIHLNVPTLLADIWDSVLRAVPKKKTSHMKKRSRFLAGKALKDVTALSRCSACGHVKRAHVLCPYCVKEIQRMFKGKSTSMTEKTAVEKPFDDLASL